MKKPLSLGFMPVESVPIGEYVKRKEDSKTVYQRMGYVRSSPQGGRYELVDCEDMNRVIRVKKGTLLFVGFTY